MQNAAGFPGHMLSELRSPVDEGGSSQSGWTALPPRERPIHIVVHVPWPRPKNFVEPTEVVWTKARQKALWHHLNQQSRDNLDWETISRQLGVPIPELLRYSTFLYEHQIQQLKEQLLIHEPMANPVTPVVDSGLTGPPQEVAASRASHPRLSSGHGGNDPDQITDNPSSRAPSTHLRLPRQLGVSSSSVTGRSGGSQPPSTDPSTLAQRSATPPAPYSESESEQEPLSASGVSHHLAHGDSLAQSGTGRLQDSVIFGRASVGTGGYASRSSLRSAALSASAVLAASMPMTASTSMTSPRTQSVSPRCPHLGSPVNASPSSSILHNHAEVSVAAVTRLATGSMESAQTAPVPVLHSSSNGTDLASILFEATQDRLATTPFTQLNLMAGQPSPTLPSHIRRAECRPLFDSRASDPDPHYQAIAVAEETPATDLGRSLTRLSSSTRPPFLVAASAFPVSVLGAGSAPSTVTAVPVTGVSTVSVSAPTSAAQCNFWQYLPPLLGVSITMPMYGVAPGWIFFF
ncbi:hypothetical protein IWQ60_000489 [Tieghemiomyces parasiticus]|uniref:Autophagy-related protein 29 n=1 Tax=Tieghemiomyces parasiticus TaxID=78921 RepID=A0A9W8E2Q7_9FUNG|nr:hypothetical protein IWQ60_000489 [Tieghemiomyces parasiticus]